MCRFRSDSMDRFALRGAPPFRGQGLNERRSPLPFGRSRKRCPQLGERDTQRRLTVGARFQRQLVKPLSQAAEHCGSVRVLVEPPERHDLRDEKVRDTQAAEQASVAGWIAQHGSKLSGIYELREPLPPDMIAWFGHWRKGEPDRRGARGRTIPTPCFSSTSVPGTGRPAERLQKARIMGCAMRTQTLAAKEAVHGSHDDSHHRTYRSVAGRRRLVRPGAVVLKVADRRWTSRICERSPGAPSGSQPCSYWRQCALAPCGAGYWHVPASCSGAPSRGGASRHSGQHRHRCNSQRLEGAYVRRSMRPRPHVIWSTVSPAGDEQIGADYV
jgi:hypothetical protein